MWQCKMAHKGQVRPKSSPGLKVKWWTWLWVLAQLFPSHGLWGAIYRGPQFMTHWDSVLTYSNRDMDDHPLLVGTLWLGFQLAALLAFLPAPWQFLLSLSPLLAPLPLSASHLPSAQGQPLTSSPFYLFSPARRSHPVYGFNSTYTPTLPKCLSLQFWPLPWIPDGNMSSLPTGHNHVEDSDFTWPVNDDSDLPRALKTCASRSPSSQWVVNKPSSCSGQTFGSHPWLSSSPHALNPNLLTLPLKYTQNSPLHSTS